MKNSNAMAIYRKQFHHKILLCSGWKKALLHWLAWLLLAAGMFYAMHRYFEYREHELDERLERLQ